MGCNSSKNKKKDVAEPEKVEQPVQVTVTKKDPKKEEPNDEEDKVHEEQKVEVVNMLPTIIPQPSNEPVSKPKVEEPIKESPTQVRKELARKALEEREKERLEQVKKEKTEKYDSLKQLLKQYITKLFTNVGENHKSEHLTCYPLIRQIRIVRKELNDLKIDFLPKDEQENYENFVLGANEIIQNIDDAYSSYKTTKKQDYSSARKEILYLCREADTDLEAVKFADEIEEDKEPSVIEEKRASSNKKSRNVSVVVEDVKEEVQMERLKSKPQSNKKKAAAVEAEVSSFEQFKPVPQQLPFEEEKVQIEQLPEFPEEKREITETERIIDKEMAYQIEKEKNDAIFEYEQAVIKLRRMKEDQALLKKNKSSLQEELALMRKEMFDMKRQQHSIAFETDSLMAENNTYRLIKDKLVQENQRVKDDFLTLKQELFTLQGQADSNIEQYHAEDKKLRIEQLEQQINQRKLDSEELRDKYNNLKVRYQEANNELVDQKANLYRKAVEQDIEAIQNGSKALPITTNPLPLQQISQNQAPKTIIADSKIAASLSLIEKAREARIEDPSMVHLDLNPPMKTVSYFNTELSKNIQMRYSAARLTERNGVNEFGIDSARNLHHSPYGREMPGYPDMTRPVY